MKAVIWTDTFQIFIMLAGFLVIIIKGSADANGFLNLFENYVDSNRTRFADFEFGLEIYNYKEVVKSI